MFTDLAERNRKQAAESQVRYMYDTCRWQENKFRFAACWELETHGRVVQRYRRCLVSNLGYFPGCSHLRGKMYRIRYHMSP